MQYPDEKILIVEDSRFNAQILSKAVSSLAPVSIASTGTQALEMMGKEDFDVVLLDIMLPDVDGFEICRRTVESGKEPLPAIIFVTSKDEAEEEEKGLSLGAVDYLYKPIVASIVRARVNNHLQLSRARRELLSANEELTRLSSTDPLTGVFNQSLTRINRRRHLWCSARRDVARLHG